MTLSEALRLASPIQYLVRDAWRRDGRIMRLMSSARTIEEIKESLELTPESLNADDWEIYQEIE